MAGAKRVNYRFYHWQESIYYKYSICFFVLYTEVDMRRLIGYSFVCMALGMLITIFIESTVVLIIIIAGLLLIGYQLFCCK